jgi:hypothetical protein
MLVLWFVITCSGDADDAKGQVISAASVGGVCVMSAVVKGAGIVAVAVAIVVECVRPFTDDGVNAKVGIVDGGDVRGDVDVDGDGVVEAAVAVVVGFISIAVAIVVIEGVHVLAGDGVGAEVGGVHLMLRGWSTQCYVGISRINIGNGRNMYGRTQWGGIYGGVCSLHGFGDAAGVGTTVHVVLL